MGVLAGVPTTGSGFIKEAAINQCDNREHLTDCRHAQPLHFPPPLAFKLLSFCMTDNVSYVRHGLLR